MSVGPFAKLELWVGTERFDLLNNKESGFLIREWQPSIPVLKGGGTWADPSTADERELVDGKLTNVEDRFIGDLAAYSENSLILYLRQMRAVLNAARQYTLTEWQGSPGYICAQGYRETNPRYTRIKNWRTLQDGFPYGPSQWENLVGSSVEDFELTIEHGAWGANAPGTGTATELSVVEAYGGYNLGNVDSAGVREPTAANGVYVANKSTVANITHIFIDDGAVFSANLQAGAVPHILLPAVPAVGDIAYFGVNAALADDGPVCSLVVDIGTAGTGYTAIWEIYRVAGWAALSTDDHTNLFQNTGINSVHWELPTDLVTFAVNGVTAWWVRLRVTVIVVPTGPTQQNRKVYSIVKPYTEIQTEDVGGDLPAKIAIKLLSVDDSGDPRTPITRIVCGLRAVSRGENFSAFLNLTNVNDQNPTGATTTFGANTALGAATDFPTASAAVYTAAGVEVLADRVTITLAPGLMQEYYGLFHVYLRGSALSGGTFSVRLAAKIGSGGIVTYSETLQSPGITALINVFDLGVINIPGGALLLTETGDQTELVIQIGTDQAGTFVMQDLVLIPLDESAGDFESLVEDTESQLAFDRYLLIDSVANPKYDTRAVLFDASDQAMSFYKIIANGPMILQANRTQRLWFFSMLASYVGGALVFYQSLFVSAVQITIERNQQYWSARGSG